MKGVLQIYKKELKSFFISPIAYIVIGVFLLILGLSFFNGYFLRNQLDMWQFFKGIILSDLTRGKVGVPMLLALAIPAYQDYTGPLWRFVAKNSRQPITRDCLYSMQPIAGIRARICWKPCRQCCIS